MDYQRLKGENGAMAKRYIGVDYSTRKVSAAAIGDSAPVAAMSLLSYSAPKKLVGLKAIKATVDAYDNWAMDGWLIESRVVIESPVMGMSRNVQTAILMAMTAGALMKSSLFFGASEVEFAAPGTWKKEVCGNGSLHKQEIQDWLRETHNGLFTACRNDDDTDAMCMALYAALEEG